MERGLFPGADPRGLFGRAQRRLTGVLGISDRERPVLVIGELGEQRARIALVLSLEVLCRAQVEPRTHPRRERRERGLPEQRVREAETRRARGCGLDHTRLAPPRRCGRARRSARAPPPRRPPAGRSRARAPPRRRPATSPRARAVRAGGGSGRKRARAARHPRAARAPVRRARRAPRAGAAPRARTAARPRCARRAPR